MTVLPAATLLKTKHTAKIDENTYECLIDYNQNMETE